MAIPYWRLALPTLPSPTRRRWGELANQFESEGLSSLDAEKKAFDFIASEIERWENDFPDKPIPYVSQRSYESSHINLVLFDRHSALPYRPPLPISIPSTLPLPAVRAILDTQDKLDKIREVKEFKPKLAPRKRKSKHDPKTGNMFS